jgi:hypothetical protein
MGRKNKQEKSLSVKHALGELGELVRQEVISI